MNPIQAILAGTRRGMGSLKVVMATGLYKTAAGVQGARLLKENAEALRAYLTIGLRTGKAAQQALAAIEDALEHGTSGELTKGPSRRSALFLLARNHVEYERLFGDAAGVPVAAVPWEATPPGRPDGWGRALDEVRFSLGLDEAEILELHHARDLNTDELAYVLSAPKDEVERKLEAGAAYAKLLLEDVFGDAASTHLERVLKEAFAVAPPTPEDLASTKVALVPLPPGTIIGERYELEERIGGGEFAFVYRARDVRVPGHVVALKLLHRGGAYAGRSRGCHPRAEPHRLGVPSVARPLQGARLVRGSTLVRHALLPRRVAARAPRARSPRARRRARALRAARAGARRAALGRHPAPGRPAGEHLPRRAGHRRRGRPAGGPARAARPRRRDAHRRHGPGRDADVLPARGGRAHLRRAVRDPHHLEGGRLRPRALVPALDRGSRSQRPRGLRGRRLPEEARRGRAERAAPARARAPLPVLRAVARRPPERPADRGAARGRDR
ncbi:MAG: hypothetical protein M5U28_29005 [Sandaracinaceae bacterium]|nr:hypothetical protein [Sandaracinaceae bacterium]